MILTHIHRRGEGMSYKYILIFGVILCIIGLWLFVPTIEGLVDTSTIMLVAIRDSGDGKADQDVSISKVGLSSNPTWNVVGKSKFISGSFDNLVSINSDGTMWHGIGALSATSAVSSSNTYKWTRIGSVTNAKQVSYDYPTILYIDTDNIINYAYYVSNNPTTAVFTKATSAKQFTWISAHLGAVYGIGADGVVWYTDNIRLPDWKNMSSSLSEKFSRVSFDGNEAVIVAVGGKTYYTRNATAAQPSWILINGFSNHVSINNRILYRIDLEKKLYFATSPQDSSISWTQISDKILDVECIFQRSANMVTQRLVNPTICGTGEWAYANKCLNNCPPTHRSDPSTGKCIGIPTARASRVVTTVPPPTYTCSTGTNVVIGNPECKHVTTGEILTGGVPGTGCPPLYRLNYPNATCLSDCPTGSTAQNRQCVFATSDKVSIPPVTTNFTCPTGYDAPMYTTCTPGTTCDMSQLCYESCPTGYTRNGTVCDPTSTAPGIKGKSTVQATSTISSYSCDTVLDPFGRYVPAGGYYTPMNVLNGTTCYETCPSYMQNRDTNSCNWTTWGITTVMPKASTPARAIIVWSCPTGYMQDRSICINSTCEANYTQVGATGCAPNVAARRTTPATYTPRCPSGYTEYSGMCYKNCDTGYNSVQNTKCQLPSSNQITGDITIVPSTQKLCNDDEELQGTNCVKKCNQTITTQETATCTPLSTTPNVVNELEVCNKGEIMRGSVCISCPEGTFPDGEICVGDPKIVDTPSTIKCTSSPFGSVKKWLCETQEDADALLKDPSAITSYVSAKDQICVADDPTTLMYFCQTVEDARNDTGYADNLRNNYYSTCNQLTSNYADLSGSTVSIKNLKEALTQGTAQLSDAKTAITSSYTRLKCDTAPTDQNKLICEKIRTATDTIGSNSIDIQQTLNAIVGDIDRALNLQLSISKNLIAFSCGIDKASPVK